MREIGESLSADGDASLEEERREGWRKRRMEREEGG